MTAQFPAVTPEQWKAAVEQDLKGVPFEKALVTKTLEGLSIQPLYTSAPAVVVPGMPASFLICDDGHGDGAEAILGGAVPPGAPFAVVKSATGVPQGVRFAIDQSPLRGHFLDDARALLETNSVAALISTTELHEAGADAVDELAVTLATLAEAIETLVNGGIPSSRIAGLIGAQIAVGRDTFLELAKLRALRITWAKVLSAAGVADAPVVIHAMCSRRTLSERDPWTNMLRTTTQVFAAILGGADLITPTAFDEALGPTSALGKRVARNTALVLRHESSLGRVVDPSAGSYFLDTLTESLARAAWTRFQEIERAGGIVAQRAMIDARVAATWQKRFEALASRKTPVLGVSDFANLDEQLPHQGTVARPSAHRDAEIFEALRTRADATKPTVQLRLLGSFADSRARAGFASTFFAAGGIRATETTTDAAAPLVCLCGTDVQYGVEAAERAKALKALGCRRVLLAGKPGPNEAALRAAGVDGFIFVGCDVVATLSQLLSEVSS